MPDFFFARLASNLKNSLSKNGETSKKEEVHYYLSNISTYLILSIHPSIYLSIYLSIHAYHILLRLVPQKKNGSRIHGHPMVLGA